MTKFEEAYNYAMKVLDKYISRSIERRDKAEMQADKVSQEHFYWKAHFMSTAKKIIEENIKVYLKYPELYKK